MKRFFTLALLSLIGFSTYAADDLTGCWTLKTIEIVEYNQITGAIITNVTLTQHELNNPLSKELNDIVISNFCVTSDDLVLTARNGVTYIGDSETVESQLSINATSMDGNYVYKEAFFISKTTDEISLEKEYTNRTTNTKAKIKTIFVR